MIAPKKISGFGGYSWEGGRLGMGIVGARHLRWKNRERERETEIEDKEEHGKAPSCADKARAGPVQGPRGVAREGRNGVPSFPSGLTFVTRCLPSRPGPSNLSSDTDFHVGPI